VITWFYFPTDKTTPENKHLSVTNKQATLENNKLNEVAERNDSTLATEEPQNPRDTQETRPDTPEPITSSVTIDNMYVEKNADGISLIIETSSNSQINLTGQDEEPITSEHPIQQEENMNDTPDFSDHTTEASGKSRIFNHTVKKGDTVWDIAKQYINDPWRYRDLNEENNIDNPELIYPGEKVKIIFQERK